MKESPKEMENILLWQFLNNTKKKIFCGKTFITSVQINNVVSLSILQLFLKDLLMLLDAVLDAVVPFTHYSDCLSVVFDLSERKVL